MEYNFLAFLLIYHRRMVFMGEKSSPIKNIVKVLYSFTRIHKLQRTINSSTLETNPQLSVDVRRYIDNANPAETARLVFRYHRCISKCNFTPHVTIVLVTLSGPLSYRIERRKVRHIGRCIVVYRRTGRKNSSINDEPDGVVRGRQDDGVASKERREKRRRDGCPASRRPRHRRIRATYRRFALFYRGASGYSPHVVLGQEVRLRSSGGTRWSPPSAGGSRGWMEKGFTDDGANEFGSVRSTRDGVAVEEA